MRNMLQLPPNEPPSAKRYLEGPDYIELCGLSAAAVAAKARFLIHNAKRQLLWFLQAMSLRPGGLDAFVSQLLADFPEQIGTPTMHAHKMARDDMRYPSNIAQEIKYELVGSGVYYRDREDTFAGEPVNVHKSTRAELIATCRALAEANLPTMLIAICINPKVFIELPGVDTSGTDARYRKDVQCQYTGINDYDFHRAAVGYFKDLVPTLFKAMQRHAERVRAQFVMTEEAKIVFRTLDIALQTGDRIAIVEGQAGVGKSASGEAWVEQRLGQARFVSLSGITNRTVFFSTLARALGIPTKAHAAAQLQAKVEELLQQTKLALIIDESNHLFGASERFRTQPELINWVYTSCTNHRIPTALLVTAAFGRKMRLAKKQGVWNSDVFESRARPHVKLPEVPRREDLIAITKAKLPQAASATVDLAVGYAGSTLHPYRNLVDAIRDAQRIAAEAGRAHPSLADMKSAVLDCRMPSDRNTAEGFSEPETRRRSRKEITEPLQPAFSEPSEALQTPDRRTNLAGDLPAENPRFNPSISGRAARDLATT